MTGDMGSHVGRPSQHLNRTGVRSAAPETVDATEFWFAGFRFVPSHRRLEKDGVLVPIGGKALDLLVIFVSRPGEVISKAELLHRLWQGQVAEETSLRFHVASLRKALGSRDLIANVARQGYSLVASVSRVAQGEAVYMKINPSGSPALPRRLIGRDGTLATLASSLIERRFITIVGPGGTGKTSVALAVGHQLAEQFDGKVCFFDVANQSDSKMLADGIALALGIPVQPTEASPQLLTYLRERRMLLILDGCEPAIHAAAALAEELFCGAEAVYLLATSREALRVEGEHVYRLQPLSYPTEGMTACASRALDFPSVQLFLERAQASDQDFSLTDENAEAVGAICRKLDGLALAIELAAGRVQAQSVEEIARQLGTQFALRWPGRRTAIPRHQTLRATLDWSYALLSEVERVALRRISIFPTSFTLDMACKLISDNNISATVSTEILGDLVSKSLLHFQKQGFYRLLDITRSYAADKLVSSGEQEHIASRHAHLVLLLLQDQKGCVAGKGELNSSDLMANVRSALQFSLHLDGDLPLAAAITSTAAPIWLQVRLLAECRHWTTRALEMIDPDLLGPQRCLTLQLALASSMIFTQGFTEASYKSWLITLELVRLLDDAPQELHCLLVLWAHMIRMPNYAEALTLALHAERFSQRLEITGSKPMTDWMVGITQHHLGNFIAGRNHLEQSLIGDTFEFRQALTDHVGYDRRIPSMGVLANTLWIQGFADQAAKLSAEALYEARSSPYAVPLCEALTWHAHTLYLRGDDQDNIDALAEEAVLFSGLHFIESYQGLALALKGLNSLKQNRLEGGGEIEKGLAFLSHSSYKVFQPWIQSEAMRLRAEAGVRLCDLDMESISALESYPEHWASAEVVRNLGEVLLLSGKLDHARRMFELSIKTAQRQGAFAWEFRAALSLFKAEAAGAARSNAERRLRELRASLTEGFMTADVRLADCAISDSCQT